MINLLSSNYFKFLIVPLVTTFLVIFIKSVSRKDGQRLFKNEDFAFGLEMAVTAILLLLANSSTIAQRSVVDENLAAMVNEKLLTIGWVTPLLIFGLWGVSTIIRTMGWKTDTELELKWGILFPNAFGLLVLIYVVSLIG